MKDIFKLPYVETCDSVQGLSIDEKYIIYDFGSPFMSKEHAYVALTRTTNLDNIAIFEHSKEERYSLINKFVAVFSTKKINEYKNQDVNRGLEIGEDYIDVREMMQLMYNGRMSCYLCKSAFYIDYDKMESDLTLDRIDSTKGHVKGNCKLCCITCNRSKSNNFQDI